MTDMNKCFCTYVNQILGVFMPLFLSYFMGIFVILFFDVEYDAGAILIMGLMIVPATIALIILNSKCKK